MEEGLDVTMCSEGREKYWHSRKLILIEIEESSEVSLLSNFRCGKTTFSSGVCRRCNHQKVEVKACACSMQEHWVINSGKIEKFIRNLYRNLPPRLFVHYAEGFIEKH